MSSETLCRKCYGWKECPNRKGMECKILINKEKKKNGKNEFDSENKSNK